MGIRFESVRVQPAVSLQMDCELALRWRRALFVERVRICSASWTPFATCPLRIDSMATNAHHGHRGAALQSSSPRGTSQAGAEDEPDFHTHYHPYFALDRLPVRAESALPILRVYCLDYTFPALA